MYAIDHKYKDPTHKEETLYFESIMITASAFSAFFLWQLNLNHNVIKKDTFSFIEADQKATQADIDSTRVDSTRVDQ